MYAIRSYYVLGVARLSRNWLVSRLAAVYVELFRNIPLLLQIFFWYFAVLRALPRITSYNVCYTKLLRAGGKVGSL